MGAGLEKGLRRKLYVALGGVGRWLAPVVKRVLDHRRRRFRSNINHQKQN